MNKRIISVEDAQPLHETILRAKTQPVSFPLSAEDQDLVETLKNRVIELEGVGLAAPQIGISKNVAVIYIPQSAVLLRDEAEVYPVHAIINASYEPIGENDIHADFEACYSVESIAGNVQRYKTIKASYQDQHGNLIVKTAKGFYARVLQHEIDHLNGILITDRLTPDCIKGTVSEMMGLKRKSLALEKRLLFDELMKKKELKSN